MKFSIYFILSLLVFKAIVSYNIRNVSMIMDEREEMKQRLEDQIALEKKTPP